MFGSRKPSDSQVVGRVLSGERDAFGILVERYIGVVHALAYAETGNHQDAEDVAQEAFLKAYRALDSLRERAKFGPWLARIVRNTCRTFTAARPREVALDSLADSNVPPAAAPDLDTQDVRALLRRRIAQMAPKAREILLLHYFADKTTREMAELLGITRHAAKKRLERAREALSKRMLAELKPAVEPPSPPKSRAEHIMGIVTAAPVSWQAGGPTSGAATGALTILGGGLLMKKATMTIVVLIGGLVALWTVTRDDSSTGTAPEDAALAPSGYPGASSTLVQPAPAPPGVRTDGEQVMASASSVAMPSGTGGTAPSDDDAATKPPASDTGTVAGHVYDADTGKGIPGVVVKATISEPGWVHRFPGEPTDASGMYRIEGLAAGPYDVGWETVDGYPAMRWEKQKKVLVVAGQTVEGVDFAIKKGLRVAGVVVDKDGNGVEAAQVVAQRVRTWQPDRTETKADGSFALYGYDAGDEIRIQAGNQDAISEEQGPIKVGSSGTDGLVLELSLLKNRSIAGRVVNLSGRGLAEVKLSAFLQGGELVHAQHTGGSDGAGRFGIEGLCPGSYKITFTPPGSNTFSEKAPPIEVPPHRDVSGVEIVYDDTGLTISGRVVDSEGKPLRMVMLTAWDQRHRKAAETYTLEDGSFALRGLAEGTYTVSTQPEGYGLFKLDGVEAGVADLDIVLQPAAAIEGRVLHADNDEPVAEFEIACVGGRRDKLPADFGSPRAFETFHDDDGRFRVQSRFEGDVTLFTRAPGYNTDITAVVGVADGETVSGVVIRLKPVDEVLGLVRDTAGRPVANARLYVGDVPYDQHTRVRSAITETRPDGAFVLSSLPVGSNTVWAFHPDYAPASIDASAEGPASGRLEIVLVKGGIVEGAVLVSDVPATDIRIRVQNRSEPRASWDTTPNREGYFRITGLPLGEVKITAYVPAADGQGKREEISRYAVLESGQVTVVDFDCRAASGVLEGFVTANGRPVADGRLLCLVTTDSGRKEVEGRTGKDGDYHFANVAAGVASLQVVCHGSDGATLFKMVKTHVEDGETVRLDIEMLRGGIISGHVSGLPAGEQGSVHAVAGVIDVPAIVKDDFLGWLWFETAGLCRIAPDGSYRIEGLEPATYTLVAVTANDTNDTHGRRIGTAITEISREGETLVDIRLP